MIMKPLLAKVEVLLYHRVIKLFTLMEVVKMANLKKPNGKSNMDEVAKAIEAAEADNVRTLEGDIEVGEDGCVHDIPLLAGYVDDDGVLQSTFPYRKSVFYKMGTDYQKYAWRRPRLYVIQDT